MTQAVQATIYEGYWSQFEQTKGWLKVADRAAAMEALEHGFGAMELDGTWFVEEFEPIEDAEG